MDIKQAYDSWSGQYDTDNNKTRDLEAVALQEVLADIDVNEILEIGCGTGKNTEYLLSKSKALLAADLSSEMLARAKQKISSAKATFIQADINKDWRFTDKQFDLITFSLVLEHIENLDFVFKQARQKLKTGALLYLGELHPFKQYSGSKARFDTEAGRTIPDCYMHNVSDFFRAAKQNGLTLVNIQEFFDDNDKQRIPRILTMIFRAS